MGIKCATFEAVVNTYKTEMQDSKVVLDEVPGMGFTTKYEVCSKEKNPDEFTFREELNCSRPSDRARCAFLQMYSTHYCRQGTLNINSKDKYTSVIVSGFKYLFAADQTEKASNMQFPLTLPTGEAAIKSVFVLVGPGSVHDVKADIKEFECVTVTTLEPLPIRDLDKASGGKF